MSPLGQIEITFDIVCQLAFLSYNKYNQEFLCFLFHGENKHKSMFGRKCERHKTAHTVRQINRVGKSLLSSPMKWEA